ncbi:hypothetical protein [Corynebacterium rouxii]|uniref:hypothetical protein n=1 Tax=Corynebacterium rouxii TaxID=2719119 RepID=UPI00313E6BFB
MGTDLDQFDPELIDGVRVLWISEGKTARDETAFRHALKVAHRLHTAGERMTDAAIIDAYEHAYKTAHRVGADGRVDEMPPMRDRQTMARRVRGYVTQAKTDAYGCSALGHATSSERKALSTMGRRGGQQAAKRWETDPNGDYAQAERKKLEQASKKRSRAAKGARLTIAGWFIQAESETGEWPTIQSGMNEFGVSRQTVNRALKAADVSLPRGRKRQLK